MTVPPHQRQRRARSFKFTVELQFWVNRSLGTAAVMLTLRLPRWSATYLGPQVDSEAQSHWGQG